MLFCILTVCFPLDSATFHESQNLAPSLPAFGILHRARHNEGKRWSVNLIRLDKERAEPVLIKSMPKGLLGREKGAES